MTGLTTSTMATTMPEKQVVVHQHNSVGNAYGPATGNAIAYFAIWYAGWKYKVSFDDSELAIAMGGALATTLILELRRAGSWIASVMKYIFTQFFPPKNPPQE